MAITLNSVHEDGNDLGSPQNIAPAGLNSVGNLSILLVFVEAAASVPTLITNNKGDTYTIYPLNATDGVGKLYLAYKLKAQTGITSVSITYTGATVGIGCWIYDCSSTTGGAPNVIAALNSQTSANPAPSLKPSDAGITVAIIGTPNTPTAAAGPFTFDNAETRFADFFGAAHDVNAGGGTITCTFTVTSSTWCSLIASFFEVPPVIDDTEYIEYIPPPYLHPSILLNTSMTDEKDERSIGSAYWSFPNVGSAFTFAGGDNFSASAFGSKLTPGSFILVGVVMGNGITVGSVTDSAGNTYFDCGDGTQVVSAGGQLIQLFYAINKFSSAGNVVTVHYTPTGNNFDGIIAVEIVGSVSGNPIEVHAGIATQASGGSGSNNMVLPTKTTTYQYDLIVALYGNQSDQTTIGTSPNLFALIAQSTNGAQSSFLLMEQCTQSAAGAIIPTAGSPNNDSYAGLWVGLRLDPRQPPVPDTAILLENNFGHIQLENGTGVIILESATTFFVTLSDDDVHQTWREWRAVYAPNAEEDEPGTLGPPPVTQSAEDSYIFKPLEQLTEYDHTAETDEPGSIQPPPSVFSDNEDLQRWVGWTAPAIEDDQSNYPVQVVIVSPNVGLDDIEAIYKPSEVVFKWDGTAQEDEPGTLGPPPQVIPDDADSAQWVDRRWIQHDDTDTNRTFPPSPPTVFTDNEDLQRWVGWSVSAIEDDQSNLLQLPPTADDSEMSKWVATFAIQEDDTDKNLVYPPRPPEVEPETADDFDVQVFAPAVWHSVQGEDVEVTVPPPPPTVFTDNEDLQRWVAWFAPALEDDQSNRLQSPPQVIPDDADSMKWAATLAVQHDDTDTNLVVPPPPPTADDSEMSKWVATSAIQEDDTDKNLVVPPRPPETEPETAEDFEQQSMVAPLVRELQGEDVEVTVPPPPPTTFTDNEDLQKWVAWSAPALEDDQSNLLPLVPKAITDDAESLIWTGKEAFQHDDTDTNRTSPPTPPPAITDDAESLIWTGKQQVYHEDAETQRAYPPTPPFSYEEEYKFLAGEIFKFTLADEESDYPVTPPVVAPNIGLDEIETMLHAQEFKAAFEPDVESQRQIPPPAPYVLQDEISEAWKAWSQIYHDDLETQQNVPPPAPSAIQDEISEQWVDRRQVYHEDAETQRAFPPTPPEVEPETADDFEVQTPMMGLGKYLQAEDFEVTVPPPPPIVQHDQAEISQWVDTRYIQHDDTDTQNTLPPTPPGIPPKSIAEEILEQWFDRRQIYHEDAETQRAFPPPPPFSFEEEYKFLAGQRSTFYLDDSTGEAMVPDSLLRLIELLLASFLAFPMYDFSEGFQAFVGVWTRSQSIAYANPALSSDMMPAPAEAEPVYSLSGFEAFGVLSLNNFVIEPLFDNSGFDRPGVPQ